MTTLLQSGNVVFTARGTDKAVAKKLADAIEASHGFRPAIMVRTAAEVTDAMKRNPFVAAARDDPGHMFVAFMAPPPRTVKANDGIAETYRGIGEPLLVAQSKFTVDGNERDFLSILIGRFFHFDRRASRRCGWLGCFHDCRGRWRRLRPGLCFDLANAR